MARHLTASETKILGALIDGAGPVEVLRQVAVRIGHDINDWEIGDDLKSAILKVANDVAKGLKKDAIGPIKVRCLADEIRGTI